MTENIPATLQKLVVPIGAVKQRKHNPRRGDVDLIAESLERNGQYRPIVVNKPTGEILAGNHCHQAATKLGWKHIAVTFVDVDEDEAARIVLADNRTADLGDYDEQILAAILSDMPDLTGTGYTEDDLDALLKSVSDEPYAGAGDPDVEDDAPDAPDAPITTPGDLWHLGPHKVLCGDALEHQELLMGKERADAVWTDPPYGVSYTGKTADALTIENDALTPAQLEAFLRVAFTATSDMCRPGAPWYVAAPAGPLFIAFGTPLNDLGIWRQTLAWVKDSFVLGRSDYHYRHEPIFYGWKPGAPRLHPVPDRAQDSVLEFSRPRRSQEHPTMKPVGLISYCLEQSTRPGDLVLDPFGGSGSTIIAAHGTSRVARVVELDPRYVDVICRRYQEHTGAAPINARTGAEVSFIE